MSEIFKTLFILLPIIYTIVALIVLVPLYKEKDKLIKTTRKFLVAWLILMPVMAIVGVLWVLSS